MKGKVRFLGLDVHAETIAVAKAMNSGTKFEARASSSQGEHEGESSAQLCDRLCRTRESSQRQLPTDHDHAVSTREYQTDQSSPKPAPAVASPVLENGKTTTTTKTTPQIRRGLTGSLHISWDTPPPTSPPGSRDRKMSYARSATSLWACGNPRNSSWRRGRTSPPQELWPEVVASKSRGRPGTWNRRKTLAGQHSDAGHGRPGS